MKTSPILWKGPGRFYSGNLVVLAELELTEVDAAACGGTAAGVVVLDRKSVV